MASLRTLQLLSVALLIGGPAFLHLVWRPAIAAAAPDHLRDRLETALARWSPYLTWAAAATGAAAMVGVLLRLSGELSGEPALAFASLKLAGELVVESNLGKVAVGRALLALAIAATLPWRSGGLLRKAVWAGLCTALLLTFPLTGHPAGSGLFSPPFLSDALHTGAMAVWLGGVAYFTLLPWRLLEAEKLYPLVSAALTRFSRLGLGAMAALALTGLYMAQLQIYGPVALIEHPYGLTLLVKLSMVTGVLALAAVNRFWTSRRLKAPEQERAANASDTLMSLVTAEAVLGVVLLVVAGMLATTAPPLNNPVPALVTLSEYRIDPPRLEMPRGRLVRLVVVNEGRLPHSYVIRSFPHATVGAGHSHGDGRQDMHVVVQPGKRARALFVPTVEGEYEVYDMLGDHLQRGMAGRLTVK